MVMNRWIGRVAIALVLFVAFVPRGTAMAWHEPTLLHATNGPPAFDRAPATDGTFVVWLVDYLRSSPHAPEPCDQLMAARLADRQPLQIADCVASFALDAGIVVWSSAPGDHNGDGVSDTDPAIVLRDLATGEQRTLLDQSGSRLTLSAGLLAWTSGEWGDEGWVTSIYTLNLAAPGIPQTIATLPPEAQLSFLQIDSGRLFWLEQTTGEDGHIAIMVARPGEQPTQLYGVTAALQWFKVVGDLVFTVEYHDAAWGPNARMNLLNVYDMAVGESHQIAGEVSTVITTDGRFIVWVDYTFPDRMMLRGYDLATVSTFPIWETVEYGATSLFPVGWTNNVAVAEGVVAWDFEQPSSPAHPYRSEIHAAALADRLPTAPRPDPGYTSNNWTYYPETSHFLSGPLRSYWERNGGLPVFGYPLTEEFQQDWRPVQSFERQRFEWHGENEGTPYEVLLGLLGTEDAQERALLDDSAFQPVSEGTRSGETCQYFSDTSHHVCDDFLRYWSSHGLEFGDSGVSYRESLALFGYPLSEPYVDVESGLTVQYFERAIFEYHPDNPEPYRVLLRRLGAEALAARGW
jgi:hypothetical protein